MRTRRFGFGRPDVTFEPKKSCGLSPQLLVGLHPPGHSVLSCASPVHFLLNHSGLAAQLSSGQLVILML